MADKRRFERYKLVLPVQIETGKDKFRSALMDISSGGMALLASEPKPKAVVKIEVSGKKLKGTILYSVGLPSDPMSGKQYYRIGIQFMNAIDRALIDQLRVHANMKSKTTVI